MSNKFLPWLIIGIVVLGAIAFAIASMPVGEPSIVEDGEVPPQEVACTLEAKICPDGSAVGRVGPNCEFAPCPSPTPIQQPAPEPEPEPAPSPSPNPYY